MTMEALNEEQRRFAEEKHGLLISFLKSNNLRREEYYDVVVFGYLEAIRQYTTDPELAAKYSISTMAYRKMYDRLYRERGKQYNRSRITDDVVSLEAVLDDTNELDLSGSVTSTAPSVWEQVLSSCVCEDVYEVATPIELETAKMLAYGYSVKETAKRFGVGESAITSRMRRLRTKVQEKGQWDIPIGRRPRLGNEASLRGR
jgi:RNA polymerase sigma-70 factor (ECF subfamily)